MLSVPEKTCRKCGSTHPATREHFRKDVGREDGLCVVCIPCERLRRNALYHQNMTPEKRERIRERAKANYAKPEQKAKKRAYEQANREKIHARKNTPEKVAQRREKERAQRRAAPEAAREKDAKRYIRDPEKRRLAAKRAKARRKAAPGKHTRSDIRRQMEAQGDKCYWCQSPLPGYFEVDHIIPLGAGGTNGPENICCACRGCNRSKNARMPWEFAGRLL